MEKKVTKKVYDNVINSIKLSILMNSGNSKTSDLHRLLLNLSDKLNLKRSDKYVPVSNPSIYCTWKNIKKSYKNNKFKVSPPTRNGESQFPHGSYSVSDIQDYFENILTVVGNPSINMYVNKKENRITFKTKTGYYLQILTPDTMKLLESSKSKINKND